MELCVLDVGNSVEDCKFPHDFRHAGCVLNANTDAHTKKHKHSTERNRKENEVRN